MELKDFIQRALLDIVGGVEGANKEKNRFKLASHVNYGSKESGQKVEFDVSVTANESTENSLNSGIKIAIVNIGGGQKASELNQNIHRIKFEVFITEK